MPFSSSLQGQAADHIPPLPWGEEAIALHEAHDRSQIGGYRKMSLLTSFTNKLNLSIKYFCVLLFIVMIVASFGQVVSRYIFEYSITWTEELARYAAIWLTFMGATVALKEKALAYVEALINALPKKISRWIALFVNALNLAFCGMMLIYGYELVGKTVGQTSPALTAPMVFVYSAAPVSGMLMILYIIEFLMIDYFGKNPPMEA